MPVFTPDGRVIALSDMHSVTLWNCKTGKNIATLDKDHITVGALAVSPDGKILCIAGWGVNPQNRNGNNPSGAQIEFWDLEAV